MWIHIFEHSWSFSLWYVIFFSPTLPSLMEIAGQEETVPVLGDLCHLLLSCQGSPLPCFFNLAIISAFLLSQQITELGDFPRGPVVGNPPSSAGDAGSNSGQGGKSPRTMRQPSLGSATIEV